MPLFIATVLRPAILSPSPCRNGKSMLSPMVPDQSVRTISSHRLPSMHGSNSDAREHEGGILVHHHIGNISLVSVLRAEFQKSSHTFDLTLKKVVHDRIHSGDFVAAS